MKATFIRSAADPLKYLLWKTQVGILHACPPLCGLVSTISLGAANSSKVWAKTLFRVAAQAPRVLFRHWSNQWNRRVVLGRITIPVTMRCTLRCDKCAAHTLDFKSYQDERLCDLLQDVQFLLSCIDYIYVVYLAGGEPFLNPDLDQIIRVCADSGKIGNISVVTNGTVIPDAKTLAALRETKTAVKISKYPPALQPDAEKLKSILKESGIPFIHESCAAWSDIGSSGQRKEGSAKRRFSVCVQHLCLPCFKGQLHLCGDSAFLITEGLIPDCKEDYIDLRAADPAAFRGQLRKLLKKRVISACSYCLGDTYKTPKIPVAAQRELT